VHSLPVQGADTNGPTSVIKPVSKIDHQNEIIHRTEHETI